MPLSIFMAEHRHLPTFLRSVTIQLYSLQPARISVRKLLACPQSHVVLRGSWERSAERDGWWIGHYILMPDHVRFFARRTDSAQPIAKWTQTWKNVSSRQIAAALDMAIWQPDYFDRYLRSRENYGQKWNYVEQNEVRAGLIREGEQNDHTSVRSLI